MTDYTISSKLSNETVYACYRGRFWRWDGSFWKESHLMTQKFERARAADKNLTPQAFLTNGAEFAPTGRVRNRLRNAGRVGKCQALQERAH